MAFTLSDIQETETMTFVASGAIVRYRAVKLHTTEGEVIETTDNDTPIGVAMETVAAGDHVRVCTAGVAPVTTGAAVALTALVHPSAADGVVDDNTATTEFTLGWALRASTAAGDIIPVKINIHEKT